MPKSDKYQLSTGMLNHAESTHCEFFDLLLQLSLLLSQGLLCRTLLRLLGSGLFLRARACALLVGGCA